MKKFTSTLIAAALVAMPGLASADSIDPVFDAFGPLVITEFGGDGIPNQNVAIGTATVGGDTLVVGLAATRRFGPPAVGNDGAGTYTALAGGFPGSGLQPANPDLARWNFSFYIGSRDGSDSQILSGLTFDVLYDFDPAADTDESDMGIWRFEIPAQLPGDIAPIETSQNLGFGFLATSGVLAPGVSIAAPTFLNFDPNALGEYSFSIREAGLGELVAINVNVVPLPAGAWLLLGGFGALAVMRRRQKAASA